MRILSFLCLLCVLCTGCTLSLNNISTSGEASDVLDEEMAPKNDVKADLTIPIKAV